MNNQSNVFYYFQDGTKLSSKILAIEYENLNNVRSNLFYHDTMYDLVDWTKEPPRSLDEYYRLQAEKIRDEYDYVILCYSGGIDSTNILETFHYNNIQLDKIISVGALSEDKYPGDDSNKNGELYHNVFPYIKELGLEDRHQVIDYTKHFFELDNFSFAQNKNWIEYTGSWLSPNNWFWKDIDRYVVSDHYKKKKTAIIFGRDKPMLLKENNKYFFRFADKVLDSYGNYSGNDNVDVINFYWDPTFPEILVKQLHILKKYLEYNTNKEIAYESYRRKLPPNKTNVANLIYKLKKPLVYISPKSPSSLFSLRDNFLRSKKNSDVYNMFKKGIRDFYARSHEKRVHISTSKRYYIS